METDWRKQWKTELHGRAPWGFFTLILALKSTTSSELVSEIFLQSLLQSRFAVSTLTSTSHTCAWKLKGFNQLLLSAVFHKAGFFATEITTNFTFYLLVLSSDAALCSERRQRTLVSNNFQKPLMPHCWVIPVDPNKLFSWEINRSVEHSWVKEDGENRFAEKCIEFFKR